MGQFTFSRQERLKKEKDIQELFKKGSSFYLYPFKVLASIDPSPSTPVQVLISVSKRNFKSAPARNTIKRRIREAYRLNKHLIPAALSGRIGFIYTSKELLPSRQISEKMVHVLRRLSRTAPRAEGQP